MSRTATRTKFTALLVLGMLGGAGVALAQTATVKARDPDPPALATATAKPKGISGPPMGRVDVEELGRRFMQDFSFDLPARVIVSTEKVNVGRYTTFDKQSRIFVKVVNRTNSNAAPPGHYRLRVKLSNVAGAAKLLVAANGANQTCAVTERLGYENVQPCEVALTTNGAPLEATISYKQGPANLTLDSIEVTKVR